MTLSRSTVRMAWVCVLLASLAVAGHFLHSMSGHVQPAHSTNSAGQARKTAPARQPPLPASSARLDTPHFVIFSSADAGQTRHVAVAVESLYTSYAAMFGVPPDARSKKPTLVLYRDRQEFQAHNRSSPWAEAYYREPRSHAYYADGKNPHHWMLHEVSHQLVREVSGFRPAKWMNEGLATYLGASQLVDGRHWPGRIDPDAYPVWWLARYRLTGDIGRDIASNQFIPLEELITDTGPGIDLHVNQYYVNYWSLTHFFLHHDNGRYAARYKRLLESGGSREKFREILGPVNAIEGEWYLYLQDLVRKAKAGQLHAGHGAH